ncbi:hypothetical protein CEXT_626221 [Caerostris extrusa]|uniref:Uncharacterized protein n=1 Tax=Caerostris extrusa TaxID=172846 RepID=A0AAV4U7S6_CAEEX|nr:hypothetical protein CEXT_626221 [Caerostris extrusa]
MSVLITFFPPQRELSHNDRWAEKQQGYGGDCYLSLCSDYVCWLLTALCQQVRSVGSLPMSYDSAREQKTAEVYRLTKILYCAPGTCCKRATGFEVSVPWVLQWFRIYWAGVLV